MSDSRPIEQHFQYCPRCGTKSTNCGSVPFRCAECQYSHFFGPVVGVGALIVNDKEELLLVRRARDPGKGKWGLPGGFANRDETIEQALARETMEETELKITSSQYLVTFPNQYNYRGIVIPVIDLFFVCRVESVDEISLTDGELTDFQWVRPSASQLDNLAFCSNRLAIEKWLETSK